MVYYLGKRIVDRLRAMRLENQLSALEAMDGRNRIEDAPPKVRQLPDGMQGQPIVVEDHMCSTCRTKKTCIVFIPCKHCFLCEDCYKEQADKKTCSKC